MSEDKMTRDELLADEPALLRGLLQAGAQVANAANAALVEIARSGALLFVFKLRPMTEAEFTACREKATTYKMVRGIKVPESHNQGLFRSLAIHKATMPLEGSKVKIWDHKEAWQQANVLSGVDLIDRVLLAGEKDRTYLILEDISGYRTEEEGGTVAALEETAGE